MLVMPGNSTGWFWHCLARETGGIGHLYSPGAERGPWPWFPYALDCGAYPCWNMETNVFDDSKWESVEKDWRRLIYWASCATQRPLWAIVPDVPGNRERTIERYGQLARFVVDSGIAPAIAVQNGMTAEDVFGLSIKPHVVCVGGTTDWKWETVSYWRSHFERVHVLRCNSPEKLYILESLGIESCDGTGWNRGDKTQTMGLETFVRRNPKPRLFSLTPYACRKPKSKNGLKQLEWAF